MHECPKNHFTHKYMNASHHATSSCHVIIPHHHAISSCHVTMPHHHAISTCYVIMPHHHAMSSCHIIMPCQHATSSWHIIMPCQHATSPCHVIMFVQYRFHVSPRQWCHVAPLFSKFACWPYRTERDKFLIWSPFEVKRMPLELSQQALQYGSRFSKIGGLQKNFLFEKPTCYLKKGFCYVMDYCWIL